MEGKARMEMGQEAVRKLEQEMERDMTGEMGQEAVRKLEQEMERDMTGEMDQEAVRKLEQEMERDMAREMDQEAVRKLEQEMERDMAGEMGQEAVRKLEQEMERDMTGEMSQEAVRKLEQEMERDMAEEMGQEAVRRLEKEREQDASPRPRRNRKKKRLTGSFVAKVFVYFLLAAGSFVAAGSLGGCILAVSEGFYEEETLEKAFLREVSQRLIDTAYTVKDYLCEGQEQYAADYCDWRGVDVDLFRADNMPKEEDYAAIRSKSAEQINKSGFRIWGTYDGSYDISMFRDYEINFGRDKEYVVVGGRGHQTDQAYIYRVYIDPEMPESNGISRTYEWVSVLYTYRYTVIWAAIAGVMVCVLCLIFLLCGAGHRNDREGLAPGVLADIHLDILSAFFGLVVLGIGYLVLVLVQMVNQPLVAWGLFAGGAAVIALWLTIFLCEFALRLKLGKWWQNTLVYVVLRGCFRILRMLSRGFRAMLKAMFRLIRGIPLVMTTLIIFLGITILEFIGCIIFLDAEGAVLWALEKAVLLVAVLYVAQVCKKLLDASAALAEGRQEHVVDTSRMFGDFKRHGENLNSIGQGISRAVAERMKSEHLKTELITNVSHDLKTPLTSIINYADLICEEKSENPKIEEYAEVLLRQSRRLKKLLEDLLEASKATTGNLEVKLEPCQVEVLLSQAVGEYQHRMEEKSLELLVRQPQEPVQVMADGRHLWRVFDNLLNNICKYAQEHSRVYLTVERQEGQVHIIFRNMSKYPLEISEEELEERFVRGDRSRHMEGNGLGLSIARSLVELQNGQMQIVTDGDLFKVVLTFREQV